MKRKELQFLPKFFDRYILLVDEDAALIDELVSTQNDFRTIQDELEQKQDYRYQPGKWTPKDILQHVIDNERIQSFRSLAFARGDQSIIPGYDEQLYANNTEAINRSIDELLEEFDVVRKSTILLYGSFTPEQLLRKGICFEIEVTPLALGFQIVGHARHHLSVLKNRYLV